MNVGIGNWLSKHVEHIPNKTALIYNDVRLSYRALNERVNQLSHALSADGIRKGDRVLALLFNTNELLEIMFACSKIGAIFVPINYRLSSSEVEYIVKHASGSLFFYDARLENVAEDIHRNVPGLKLFVCQTTTTSSFAASYEQLLTGRPASEPGFIIDSEDPHMIMYTSGTTGKPKGVIITHGNTQWNAINCIGALPIKRTDITYTAAPMFHIGGMNIFTTPTLYQGGTIILADVFDPKSLLETIEREKVTSLFLVPAMWLGLMHAPYFHDFDSSSLQMNISGGAPCPPTVITFFQDKGIPFYEGFGLTETAPFVSVLDDGNCMRKRGSIGKAPMHTTVKVVDSYKREVPIGEVGELAIKGRNVFAGYWNDPRATADALQNGWFYSGDLAKIDEEGFLYIIDRKKDMIISGGENIYPIELENILYQMPNVKEAAVIGVPDERWGEVAKAFVAVKDPEQPITLQHMEEFFEGKIARFKMPKQLEIIESLPRNTTGKVLKTKLRESVRIGEGR